MFEIIFIHHDLAFFFGLGLCVGGVVVGDDTDIEVDELCTFIAKEAQTLDLGRDRF